MSESLQISKFDKTDTVNFLSCQSQEEIVHITCTFTFKLLHAANCGDPTS